MKYDDASWHSDGDFPRDLPPEAGGTHIAMFFARALLRGLGSAFHTTERPEILAALSSRQQTPNRVFMGHCDGKLIADDLSEEGNAFATSYYGADGAYYVDLADVAAAEKSIYHLPDSWETFDGIAPVLDARLTAWRGR